MNKGGYQIIDLKNKPMSINIGMIFEGLYDLIEGTRKPTLLSGLIIDDVELNDRFVIFDVNGSEFVAEIVVGGLINYIHISDTDVVTINIEREEI